MRRVLETIEESFKHQQGSGMPVYARRLMLIEQLDEELTLQFAVKTNGDFGDVLRIAPRLNGWITNLYRERREVLSGSCELVAQARQARLDPNRWQRVHSAFRELGMRLRAHDQAEGRLTVEAFHQDLGGEG